MRARILVSPVVGSDPLQPTTRFPQSSTAMALGPRSAVNELAFTCGPSAVPSSMYARKNTELKPSPVAQDTAKSPSASTATWGGAVLVSGSLLTTNSASSGAPAASKRRARTSAPLKPGITPAWPSCLIGTAADSLEEANEAKSGLKSQVTRMVPSVRATLTSGVELAWRVLLSRNGESLRAMPLEAHRRATIPGLVGPRAHHVTTKLPSPSLPTDGPVCRSVWSVLTRNGAPTATPEALNCCA